MGTNTKFSVRTDLAVEVREIIGEQNGDMDDGIVSTVEQLDLMEITTVEIIDENGSKAMNRPIGSYITIESKGIRENDPECHRAVTEKLAESITNLCSAKKDATFLIVGLGNWNITPDALGPKVVNNVFVTRHIFDTLPEELEGDVRPMAAVSPGVMGITGIETGEIIKGITEKIKPDFVIAVDALAARRSSRINATIQLSDTGIIPGSGVGNKRKALNQETLGVPVIAIGVPTVVDAATLVNDTMDNMLKEMMDAMTQGSEFYNMLEKMETEDRYQLICDTLTPYEGNMFVTPKEVDAVIDRLAKIIADAINISVHSGISLEDTAKFV